MCNADAFVKWIPQTWVTVKSNQTFRKASQNPPIKCLRSYFMRPSVLSETYKVQKASKPSRGGDVLGKERMNVTGCKRWRLTVSKCRFKCEKSGVSKSRSHHGSGYIKNSSEWVGKGSWFTIRMKTKVALRGKHLHFTGLPGSCDKREK